MKKGVIISIIIVIALVVAGGIYLYLEFLPKQTSYFVDRVIEENNATICLEIETESSVAKYPMDCFRGVASRTSDILICQTLDSEIEINNCYTAFIHTRSENNDEILCDKLDQLEDKNYCYMVTSIARKDSSFCDKIDTTEFETAIEDCKSNLN